MRKSIVWIPVLFVGALVYWTLALGFGGLSLLGLTSDFPEPEPGLHDSYQSIRVNLGGDQDTEEHLSGDGVGSVTVDLVSDWELRSSEGEKGSGGRSERNDGRRPTADPGPGETAF